MARAAIEIAVAAIGIALVVCAILSTQPWLDRHFMPSWFVPHRWYVTIESSVRVMVAGVGVTLALFLRQRVGRFLSSVPGRGLSLVVAALLGLGAAELVLRRVHPRATEWLAPSEEPLRRFDARLGWTFVPARSGQSAVGGRVIDYSFDSAGYRVRRVDEPVDPSSPTVVFVGESVMFGEGLTWEESIPAQVGALLEIQSANLSVHGFGTDQAYLRLETELPRFHRPVAVVSLFMTALFGRNLDQDRPHLGPGLMWLPATPHGRLASLATWLVPYRSDETVERGIAMTRDALSATVNLARARGATPLIVVPHFGGEDQAERTLRRRILDESGLPYVWIEIHEAWRLPWDRHPNAHAAHEIARAIAARLNAAGARRLGHDVEINRHLVFHLDRATGNADGRDPEVALLQRRRSFEVPLRANDLNGDRTRLPMHGQLASDRPAVRSDSLDRHGAKTNLRELIGVEDLGSQHPCLYVLTIFRRKTRIQHPHASHVDGEADARRRRVVERSLGERRFNDVVISQGAKQARLEHSDRDGRLLRVDGPRLRLAR